MADGVLGTGGIGSLMGCNGFLLLLLLFILLASCCTCGSRNFFFIIILAIIAFGGFGRTFGLLGGADTAL